MRDRHGRGAATAMHMHMRSACSTVPGADAEGMTSRLRTAPGVRGVLAQRVGHLRHQAELPIRTGKQHKLRQVAAVHVAQPRHLHDCERT